MSLRVAPALILMLFILLNLDFQSAIATPQAYNSYLPRIAKGNNFPLQMIGITEVTACSNGGQVFVYGVVKNGSGQSVKNIRVVVTFFMPDGTPAGTATATPSLEALLPGQQTAFVVIGNPETGWVRREAAVTYTYSPVANTPNLPISEVAITNIQGGLRVSGKVTNNTDRQVNMIKIVELFRGASGSLLTTTHGYPLATELPSGEISTFILYETTSGCANGIVNVDLFAIGQFTHSP